MRALSVRQAEVFGLFRLGLSRKEVCARTGLSESRVKQHIKNILKKVASVDTGVSANGGPDRWYRGESSSLVELWRALWLAEVGKRK